MLAQLHQRAFAYESRSKETAKTIRHNVHIVECDQSSSDNESTEIYAVEMVWPKQAKSSACSSLQPVQKKRQVEVKFTFNVGKCDKIFNELLKNGNIKINHTIPSADELKRRAYLSGTIIRGTLKTPNSQLVTPISIKLQRPDGYD
jgi:hypothetical protein